MNRIQLILPTPEYKEKIMNYKQEFIENRDSMDGTAGLRDAETFEEWYRNLLSNMKEETVKDGLVPATTFLAITNDEQIIGMIDIRHRLNDFLLNYGGHIGYSVKKSKRQKGYATEMLCLALEECKKLNIKRVLLTCDKENIASAKTIINNAGILENEVQEEDRITQRYWITLDKKCPIIIRKANKSDAKAMLEYVNKISRESDNLTFGNGEFKQTLEQEENFIDNISKRNNAIFLIAEIDGKIIGNLSFLGGLRPRIAHTGEFGVSVLKEYWGQGIGTNLIKYLINWSKESGIIRKINLRVRSDNHPAIHVYKKFGFIEEGLITRDLFINGSFYDSISMGMKID